MASTLGIHRATVLSTQDPAGKGRLRLRLTQLFGDTPTDWIDPSIPGGLIPAPGTTVWVMFVGGDVNQPVYISGSPEPDLSPYALDSAVVHNTGDENVNGTKSFFGDTRQYLQFRLHAGGAYGLIFRNDGVNTYFLLTNNADHLGTWNSLRPFYIVNSTGRVKMENGVDVLGGLTSGGTSVATTTDVDDTRILDVMGVL